ncbi:MAG: aspartate/glutamate racemase family protein [Chloroflexota bacterium]|nr:aspartate/glutamate racemase family protein [Chloroflexota bacterium]
MAKICVVNLIPEEIGHIFTHYAKEISGKVWRPETELGIKSPNPGMATLSHLCLYFDLLNKRELVEKALEAEQEGYDAVVIHCFLDPGVREAKSVLNIPVIGPAESSLLAACTYGQKFGIVTISEPLGVKQMETMIRDYGLQDRAIHKPVRPISMPWPEWLRKGTDEAIEEVLPDIIEKAKDCVDDGADVVVIGCTMLGPICTLAGISKIPDMDVPILDCLSVALKTAETVVDFNTSLGLPCVGRSGIYRNPRAKDLERNRTAFGLKPLLIPVS